MLSNRRDCNILGSVSSSINTDDDLYRKYVHYVVDKKQNELSICYRNIISYLELMINSQQNDNPTYHLDLTVTIPSLFFERISAGKPWSLFQPPSLTQIRRYMMRNKISFKDAYEFYEKCNKHCSQIDPDILFSLLKKTIINTGGFPRIRIIHE